MGIAGDEHHLQARVALAHHLGELAAIGVAQLAATDHALGNAQEDRLAALALVVTMNGGRLAIRHGGCWQFR